MRPSQDLSVDPEVLQYLGMQGGDLQGSRQSLGDAQRGRDHCGRLCSHVAATLLHLYLPVYLTLVSLPMSEH